MDLTITGTSWQSMPKLSKIINLAAWIATVHLCFTRRDVSTFTGSRKHAKLLAICTHTYSHIVSWLLLWLLRWVFQSCVLLLFHTVRRQQLAQWCPQAQYSGKKENLFCYGLPRGIERWWGRVQVKYPSEPFSGDWHQVGTLLCN